MFIAARIGIAQRRQVDKTTVYGGDLRESPPPEVIKCLLISGRCAGSRHNSFNYNNLNPDKGENSQNSPFFAQLVLDPENILGKTGQIETDRYPSIVALGLLEREIELLRTLK